MKRLLLIAFITLSINAIAQTNTFRTNGNVGIGTTNPSSPLHILTNSSLETNILTLHNTSPWSNGQIHNIVWRDQVDAITGAIGMQYDRNGNVDFKIHSLYNGNYKNSSVTSFTVKGNGNVGIGTDNPAAKLDVNGNIVQSGALGYNSFSSGLRIDVGGGTNNALYVNGDTRFGIDFTGPKTGVIKYNTNLDAFIIDTWSSGKEVRIGGSKLILGVGEGNQLCNVGIGTQNPAYNLDVLGTIRAKEVLVNLDGGADFVFEKEYKLPTIEHVATYVQENKHLPDIPSAKEMTKNGVSVGDMQVKLLQKVEELTLYAIQQNKKIVEQETDRKTLEKKYDALFEKVEMLTKQIEKK